MAASDDFVSQPVIMTYSARNLEAVTPDDVTELARVSRALWVGTAGNITVLTAGDQTVLIPNVPGGTLLPIQIKRVNSASTTASNMVSFY